jgi:hypothetical protein
MLLFNEKTQQNHDVILFQILVGSTKLLYYTLRPGILRFLGKNSSSLQDPLLELKGNHTDLHYTVKIKGLSICNQ